MEQEALKMKVVCPHYEFFPYQSVIITTKVVSNSFPYSKGASYNSIKRKLRKVMLHDEKLPKEPYTNGRPLISFYDMKLLNEILNFHILLLIRFDMENFDVNRVFMDSGS